MDPLALILTLRRTYYLKKPILDTLHKCANPPALSKTVSGHDLLLFWNGEKKQMHLRVYVYNSNPSYLEVELPVQSIPERQQVMN